MIADLERKARRFRNYMFANLVTIPVWMFCFDSHLVVALLSAWALGWAAYDFHWWRKGVRLVAELKASPLLYLLEVQYAFGDES
jgi:hypothetical protein